MSYFVRERHILCPLNQSRTGILCCGVSSFANCMNVKITISVWIYAVQDLLSEVSRCTRLVREMKQKGPLEQYLMDKLKALNTEVIAFKSSLL